MSKQKDPFGNVAASLGIMGFGFIFLAIWTRFHIEFLLSSFVILFIANASNDLSKKQKERADKPQEMP